MTHYLKLMVFAIYLKDGKFAAGQDFMYLAALHPSPSLASQPIAIGSYTSAILFSSIANRTLNGASQEKQIRITDAGIII